MVSRWLLLLQVSHQLLKQKERKRVPVSCSLASCTFCWKPLRWLPLGLIGQRWPPFFPRRVNICLSNLYSMKWPWERRLTVAFWQQQKNICHKIDAGIASCQLTYDSYNSIWKKKKLIPNHFCLLPLDIKWMHPFLVPILYIKKQYYYSFYQASLLTRR